MSCSSVVLEREPIDDGTFATAGELAGRRLTSNIIRRMTDEPNIGSARPRAPAAVFFGIGVVFLAVGSSGQRSAMIAVGAAFLAIGVVLLVRQKRAGGPR
jgi:hypothetical protein